MLCEGFWFKLLELASFSCDDTTVSATNALSGGRSVLNAVSKDFLLKRKLHSPKATPTLKQPYHLGRQV